MAELATADEKKAAQLSLLRSQQSLGVFGAPERWADWGDGTGPDEVAAKWGCRVRVLRIDESAGFPPASQPLGLPVLVAARAGM